MTIAASATDSSDLLFEVNTTIVQRSTPDGSEMYVRYIRSGVLPKLLRYLAVFLEMHRQG